MKKVYIVIELRDGIPRKFDVYETRAKAEQEAYKNPDVFCTVVEKEVIK